MNLDPMPHVIILSAVGQDKITQRSISLGSDYYVLKPFDMEVLIKRIRHILAKSSDDEKKNLHMFTMAILKLKSLKINQLVLI
jgi:two-component system response regulator (stage 0 sporulation protein A)